MLFFSSTPGYLLKKAKKAKRLVLKKFEKKQSPPDYNLNLYKKLFSTKSIAQKRFYNVGAGRFYHPYWTNIDHRSQWYNFEAGYFKNNGNINFDLLTLGSLPIRSSTAEIIYSSHTVEHITDAAAQNMFSESHRILKKGGYLRLTMPNVDLHYRAYRDNDRDYFFWVDYYSQPGHYENIYTKPLSKATIGELFLENFATSTSPIVLKGEKKRITERELKTLFATKSYEAVLNYCTSKCSINFQKKHAGNHINWWNKKKTFRMLQKAGFKNIFLSGYRQSFCPVLRDSQFFDNTNPQVSLYVEAVK